jgi:hypothetical protein
VVRTNDSCQPNDPRAKARRLIRIRSAALITSSPQNTSPKSNQTSDPESTSWRRAALGVFADKAARFGHSVGKLFGR